MTITFTNLLLVFILPAKVSQYLSPAWSPLLRHRAVRGAVSVPRDTPPPAHVPERPSPPHRPQTHKNTPRNPDSS